MPQVAQVTHVRAVTTKLPLGSKPKSFLHVSLRCGAVCLPSNPVTAQAGRPLSAPSSHPLLPIPGKIRSFQQHYRKLLRLPSVRKPVPRPSKGRLLPTVPPKSGPSPVFPRSTCVLSTAGRRLQPCRWPAGSGAGETARPHLEAQPSQPFPRGLGGSRAGEPPPAVSAQSPRPPEPWASPRSPAGSDSPGAPRPEPLRALRSGRRVRRGRAAAPASGLRWLGSWGTGRMARK